MFLKLINLLLKEENKKKFRCFVSIKKLFNEPHHTILYPLVVIVACQTANFPRQLRQIEEFIKTRFGYDNRLQKLNQLSNRYDD